MKMFAPGLRGGSYSEADDLNMQIEIVNGQAFLDRWAGGGWKNISVHKSYEEALQARAEIRSMIREWRENEREACAKFLEGGVDLAGLAGAPDMQRFTGELLMGCAKAIRARGEK